MNTRAGLLDTDPVIDSAYDPYAFVRNAWLQRREYQIHNGKVPETMIPEDESDRKPPEEGDRKEPEGGERKSPEEATGQAAP